MDIQNLRRVRVGFTHNCGDYQSVRLDLEFEPSHDEIGAQGIDSYLKELAGYVQSECRKMAPDYRVKSAELQQISKQLEAARETVIAIEKIASHAPILATNLLQLGYIQPTNLSEDEEEDENMLPM